MDNNLISRALISVSDKNGLIEFAKFLQSFDIEIISTGGTAEYLRGSGLEIKEVSQVTNFPEMLDGRVKTLHPLIHGGLLGKRNNITHQEEMLSNGIERIDMLVVNLYPFEEAVHSGASKEECIENIDIGGPAMIRSAAKNFNDVVVVTSPSDYLSVIKEMKSEKGSVSRPMKRKLASKAFSLTAYYDSKISLWFNNNDENYFPDLLSLSATKSKNLRYGENPHQIGAFYEQANQDLDWTQYQGKDLSYNNYMDLQSAFDIVDEFSDPSCAIIKHSNPCGFATGSNLVEAYNRSVSCDPISYFGGIVSFNKEVCKDLAEKLIEPFLECIIAPSFSKDALNILKKKKNLRVIALHSNYKKNKFEIRSTSGGFLIQESDSFKYDDFSNFQIVTDLKPDENVMKSLKLGWVVVRFVKSNAIVIANKNQILGVGAGQMSRVDSVRIAIRKIKEFGLSTEGAVMASDAFFPFPDCLELASEIGVKSVIQPGGSRNDDEVIKAANNLGMSMVLTSVRHFYH